MVKAFGKQIIYRVGATQVIFGLLFTHFNYYKILINAVRLMSNE